MDQSVSSGSIKRNPSSPFRVMMGKRSVESGRETDLVRKRVKLRDLDSLCSTQESSIIKAATAVQGMMSGEHRKNLEETSKSDQGSDIESNSFGHNTAGIMPSLSSNHEVEASRAAEASVPLLSNRYQAITPGRNALSLLGAAACLSSGHVDNPEDLVELQSKAQTANNLVGDLKLESTKHAGEAPSVTEILKNHENNTRNHVRLVDDFRLSQPGEGLKNEENITCVKDHDQFHTSRNLNHLKSKESLDFDCKASECGSCTGPVEETEPWKLWKAMKQNGFLSTQAHASLHRGIPIPKVRPLFRKTKTDVLKQKLELAKKEQVNRFTKIAAPSGLLTELNPGIINHVRNSKQVHSIIEALVRSEKLDGRIRNRPTTQSGRGIKEINNLRKDLEGSQDSGLSEGSGFSLNSDEDDENPKISAESREIRDGHPRTFSRFSFSSCSESKMKPSIAPTSERSKNSPLQKQLPALTKPTENASCLSIEDLSTNQDSVNSLSVIAATVASQWLELLSQDLKGRLSALRRSKKRVRSMIQTELPSMASRELSLNKENNLNFSQSSDAGSAMNAAHDMHVARWRSLFDQMDKALSEEGKHLESRLRQVKEMQAHCVRGLQCMDLTSTDGLPDSRSKKAEALERECAIRAAAASIYSTCNLVMTTENVSCF